MMNSYTIFEQLMAVDGVSAPDELILFVDGRNRMSGANTVIVNEESAAKVIAEFKDRGVEIPIDFEHSTITRGDIGLDAPAVGWIYALRYEKGVGLIAKVKWNEQAEKLIENKQYKYHSPVALIDDETNEVIVIHSVALTNTPRTKHQKELLAAKLSAIDKYKEKNMTKAKKGKADGNVTLTLKGSRKKLQRVFKMLTAEEVLPDIDIDTAELPEEQVEQLDEVGQKLEELKEVVVAAANGTGDESAVDIIDMAISIIEGGVTDSEDEEDNDEEMSLQASLRAKLNLPKNSNTKVVIAKVDSMKVGTVSVSQFKKVQDQLAALNNKEQERNADLLVAKYVESGQLNPFDEDQMSWANESARSDAGGFEKLIASAPVVATPGQLTKTDSSGKPKSGRDKLIASLSCEFDDNPDKMKGIEKKHYINSGLGWEHDEENMTDKEIEVHCKS